MKIVGSANDKKPFVLRSSSSSLYIAMSWRHNFIKYTKKNFDDHLRDHTHTHETVGGVGFYPPKCCCVAPSSSSSATGVLFVLSSDCSALRDGLLHHGACDGAVLVGDGIAHTLHRDVRRVGRVRAQTDDNQRVLKQGRGRSTFGFRRPKNS